MTYLQAVKYLESFVNYEKISAAPYRASFKLDRFRAFLKVIGDPQKTLRCVHIAGSKGKGSTCAFISYILRNAGYKVGLYTSPHLSDFRERIRVLSHQVTKSPSHKAGEEFEGMISRQELTQIVNRLKPAIEKFHLRAKYGRLSFFEVYTSLAFLYFKEKKADFVVLETGLGGRLDATNTINPLVCVLTPISYEHTQQLGNTLKAIAKEKAGIIKSHQVTRSPGHQLPVISAPQEREALQVIEKKCRDTGSRLYLVGKDIKYKKAGNGFTVKGLKGTYPDLKVRLLGEHQLVNASAAIAAIEALGLSEAGYIRTGLNDALWPGRCEVISRKPYIVLDGAQNVASAQAIKKAVKENFKYKKLILVFGISADKDIEGVCWEFYRLADKIIITRSTNPRAAGLEKIAGYFKGKEVYLTENVKQARSKAMELARPQDLVLVTGSLFVVGEFRNESA